VLLFTPASLPALAFGGGRDDADRALPYYYGITAGMLVYVISFGLPTLA
jgi:hypothetical protein